MTLFACQRFLVPLATGLAGCMTLAPAHAAGRPDAVVQIDARPGEFQLFRASLDAEEGKLPEPIRFEFDFRRLQPSGKWVPTLTLCVYAGVGSRESCIGFARYADSKGIVTRFYFKADEDADVQTVRIDSLLDLAASHTVDIAFLDHKLSFSVDGEKLHEQEVKVNPNAYYFSCSSMVCGISIYQPPGRP